MADSSLGGFAEGFWGRIDQQRAREFQEEQNRSQREGEILSLLANHGTPEVQALALQGLVDAANPKMRKKGLAGFLGQYQPSAAVGQLYSLLQTPERVEKQVPDGEYGLKPQPIDMLGTPATTPTVEPTNAMGYPTGAPAPSAGVRYQATPPPMRTEVSYQPRKTILTPDEQRIQGEVAGLTSVGIPNEQALQLISQKYQRYYRGGAGRGLMKGDIIPDMNSPTGYSRVFLDPYSGQEVSRMQAADPRKTGIGGRPIDLGDPFEIAARAEGFANGASVTDPMDVERVMARASQYGANMAGAKVTARGMAEAALPGSALSPDDRVKVTQSLHDDVIKLTEPERKLRYAVSRMDNGMAAARRGDTVFGHEAVLVTFQKMLDEDSVVREAEYRRPGQNLGLIDRAQGFIDRLKAGGSGVPLEELEKAAVVAHEIYDTAKKIVEEDLEPLRNRAREAGIPEENVFGRRYATPPGPPSANPGARQGAINLGGGAAAPPASGTATPGKVISRATLAEIGKSMTPPVPAAVLEQKYLANGYTVQ